MSLCDPIRRRSGSSLEGRRFKPCPATLRAIAIPQLSRFIRAAVLLWGDIPVHVQSHALLPVQPVRRRAMDTCGRPAMKQGGAAPSGKWMGQAVGGVAASHPLVLLGPPIRPSGSSLWRPAIRWRIGCVSWSGLVEAQGDAAAALPSPSPLASLLVERAVKERLSPIASDDHPRDAAW
jgi:hypothetical protein